MDSIHQADVDNIKQELPMEMVIKFGGSPLLNLNIMVSVIKRFLAVCLLCVATTELIPFLYFKDHFT